MMKWFFIFIIVVSFVFICEAGKRKTQGKVRYELNWVDGFKGCDDFDNDMIDATGMSIDKDSPTTTAMSGKLLLMEPLLQDTEVLLIIEKETSQGKIIAYTMEVNDLCDHVAEKGMPWSIFFEAMKLEDPNCPIPAATYEMADLKLSMGFLDESLNRETVGEYVARLELRRKGKGLDVIEHDVACYLIGFTVDEVRDSA